MHLRNPPSCPASRGAFLCFLHIKKPPQKPWWLFSILPLILHSIAATVFFLFVYARAILIGEFGKGLFLIAREDSAVSADLDVRAGGGVDDGIGILLVEIGGRLVVRRIKQTIGIYDRVVLDLNVVCINREDRD